jgi:hypothetical protein
MAQHKKDEISGTGTGTGTGKPEIHLVEAGEDAQRIAQGMVEAQNWSSMIRFLAAEGFKKSVIAHMISEFRGYQMSVQQVNNVLSKPLKGTGQGGRGPGRPKAPEDPRAAQVMNAIPRIPKPMPMPVSLKPFPPRDKE